MLNLKTVLNHAQPIPGFVYEQAVFLAEGENARIDVVIRAHEQIHPKCSKWPQCEVVWVKGMGMGKWKVSRPGYDQLAGQCWRQVSLWNILYYLHYAPRRVNCPTHGIIVEHMPWSQGKRPLTVGMIAFLAMWARRMSWLEYFNK